MDVKPPSQQSTGSWLRVVGPGLIVAATGVGAGDLVGAYWPTASWTAATVAFGWISLRSDWSVSCSALATKASVTRPSAVAQPELESMQRGRHGTS